MIAVGAFFDCTIAERVQVNEEWTGMGKQRERERGKAQKVDNQISRHSQNCCIRTSRQKVASWSRNTRLCITIFITNQRIGTKCVCVCVKLKARWMQQTDPTFDVEYFTLTVLMKYFKTRRKLFESEWNLQKIDLSLKRSSNLTFYSITYYNQNSYPFDWDSDKLKFYNQISVCVSGFPYPIWQVWQNFSMNEYVRLPCDSWSRTMWRDDDTCDLWLISLWSHTGRAKDLHALIFEFVFLSLTRQTRVCVCVWTLYSPYSFGVNQHTNTLRVQPLYYPVYSWISWEWSRLSFRSRCFFWEIQSTTTTIGGDKLFFFLSIHLYVNLNECFKMCR